jgi:phosphatidylserine/phosphatidylglycerophosphate/cardiolipin synthase-like enzyme
MDNRELMIMAEKSEQEIDHTIVRNIPRLAKYGVLTVRPGYEITGHQLTGRRAIVATVHTKKPLAELAPSEKLPDRLDGVPVDVREARPYQRLRAADPLAAEISQRYSRPEDAEPEWSLEREVSSGKLIDDAASDAQTRLAAQAKQQPAAASALRGHQEKPSLPYEPKGCPPLVRTPVTANVTAAASPDAGLATLKAYLAGTKTSLVIGMYDFTSAGILNAFEQDLAAPKTLQLVLDDPAPNPTRDQVDSVTISDLHEALTTRAKTAWALTRGDHFAAKWSFPYAYHIKVIVRDNSAVWLSSGNLNNSNEPDLSNPPSAEDRDWHIIIEDPKLAQTFAAYLDFDYRTASANQVSDPQKVAANATTRAIVDAHAKRARETNPPPPVATAATARKPAHRTGGTSLAAKTFKNLSLNVTPMLTPDRLPGSQPVEPGQPGRPGQPGQYLSNVLTLIKGAQQSIRIELQYIEASKGDGSLYDQLLQALADKIAAGTKVQLIVSADYAEKWGEKMKSTGVDLTANIHTYPSVHNKGFVVDSKAVIVSSQNFSPAGIDQNRDAGVILESPELAQYFGQIFDADWQASRPLVVKAAGAKNVTRSGAKKGKKTVAKKTARKAKKTVPRKTTKNAKKGQ